MKREVDNGVCLGDVYRINYFGINIFFKVCDVKGNTAYVQELETKKLRVTDKLLDAYKKKHPGDKIVSPTGWIEYLKRTTRVKRKYDKLVVPYTEKYLKVKTDTYLGKPVIYIPINSNTVVYHKCDKTINGLMRARPFILYDDKYAEKRKKLYEFFTYIPPKRVIRKFGEA